MPEEREGCFDDSAEHSKCLVTVTDELIDWETKKYQVDQ